jgi:hypothetical protein
MILLSINFLQKDDQTIIYYLSFEPAKMHFSLFLSKRAIMKLYSVLFLIGYLLSGYEKKKKKKTVYGYVEKAKLVDVNLFLPAKLDTGAKSASLSAIDIQEIEKNGKIFQIVGAVFILQATDAAEVRAKTHHRISYIVHYVRSYFKFSLCYCFIQYRHMTFQLLLLCIGCLESFGRGGLMRKLFPQKSQRGFVRA